MYFCIPCSVVGMFLSYLLFNVYFCIPCSVVAGVEMLGAQVPAGTQHFSWELNIAS